MRKSVGPSLISIALALAGCGQPGDPAGPQASYGGTWQLVSGRDTNGPLPMVKGYRVTLQIEDGQVGGTSACNSYGGPVEIEGEAFHVDGLGGTDMACREDVMESESSYLEALQKVDRITRSGDLLVLEGPSTELRYELQPPVPTAGLVETRWELESLIYGEGDSGIASSAEDAYLILHEDGSIEGTTGCRDLYGDWASNGDEVTFTTFGAEGSCPKALREQDGHVVGSLGDGFRAEIEANRLTVTGRFQSGLEYIAAD